MKGYYEEKIKRHKIIEELVCKGMKARLQELAYEMVKVEDSETLKAVIEETKELQEAVKSMLEDHQLTIDIYERDYKGE